MQVTLSKWYPFLRDRENDLGDFDKRGCLDGASPLFCSLVGFAYCRGKPAELYAACLLEMDDPTHSLLNAGQLLVVG